MFVAVVVVLVFVLVGSLLLLFFFFFFFFFFCFFSCFFFSLLCVLVVIVVVVGAVGCVFIQDDSVYLTGARTWRSVGDIRIYSETEPALHFFREISTSWIPGGENVEKKTLRSVIF